MDSTLFALMILSRTARSAAAFGGLRSLTRRPTRTTSVHAIKAATSISAGFTNAETPRIDQSPIPATLTALRGGRWRVRMEAIVTRAGATARELSGAGIIAAIKASGIEYVLSVPDITTSAGLLAPIGGEA